jgi:hypothetical protein
MQDQPQLGKGPRKQVWFLLESALPPYQMQGVSQVIIAFMFKKQIQHCCFQSFISFPGLLYAQSASPLMMRSEEPQLQENV